MREDILKVIRCPLCHSTSFEVSVLERNEQEIREGELVCRDCGHHHPIQKGVLNLLPNPTPVIRREQAGWVEMLGETNESLVATMLQLPYLEDEIWVTTYQNFDQVMAQVDLTGASVLDVGAGRCWSARHFCRSGARFVLAIDILAERFIGLETADIFIERDGCYFERVLGDMNDLPVRRATFDVAFMTATLHHASDPGRAMAGVADALVPGGIAIVINEPVRSLVRRKTLADCAEIAHGINENVYSLFVYLRSARRAGLRPRLFFPRSVAERLTQGDPRAALEMGFVGHCLVSRLWRYRPAREALQGWLLPALYTIASMPLVMVARKVGYRSGENRTD